MSKSLQKKSSNLRECATSFPISLTKKINDLSYGGLAEMERFVRERLGVELFQDDERRGLLTVLIELRNIHTHNRGVVNELFLTRVGSGLAAQFEFKTGKRHHVDYDEFCMLSKAAIEVAIDLDAALTQKFKLQRFKFHNRLKAERARKEKTLGKDLPPMDLEFKSKAFDQA